MLEIRNGGVLFLNGMEIGRIDLFQPFREPEIVGFWYCEDSPELWELFDDATGE